MFFFFKLWGKTSSICLYSRTLQTWLSSGLHDKSHHSRKIYMWLPLSSNRQLRVFKFLSLEFFTAYVFVRIWLAWISSIFFPVVFLLNWNFSSLLHKLLIPSNKFILTTSRGEKKNSSKPPIFFLHNLKCIGTESQLFSTSVSQMLPSTSGILL